MSGLLKELTPLAAVVLVLAALLTTLGVVTCVVTHFRTSPWYPPTSTNTSFPMLTLASGHHSSAGGMDRELGAQRDRQIRLASVHTDLSLDLPPSIPLPDGEEIPYGSSSRLHIRDSEQESEIYQKCIRAPPNRTIFDGGDAPLPYRCHSAGMLSSTSAYSMPPSGLHNQACVVRSHSMSSSRHPHISSTLPSSSVVISSSTTVVPSVIIQPHTRHMTSHNQSSKSSGDLVIGQSSSSLRHNYHQPSSLTPTSSLTTKPSSIVISTTSNCTESCSNLISNQSHSSNLSTRLISEGENNQSPSTTTSSLVNISPLPSSRTITYSYTPPNI
ncbi:hypothetical protein M8J76_006402 [Diaphorina citri]|nr:hypothetical protein M8J76_006402 [Diaphorina citri]KAI5718057.1 hypothetical protein M8J77_015507 [Diaphorina citri]